MPEPTPVKCELFYSTGGHGGPYASAELAIAEAKRLLLGLRREHSIQVRLASDHATVLAKVTREQAEATLASPDFATNATLDREAAYRDAARELGIDIIVMPIAVGAWHHRVKGYVGIYTSSNENSLALMRAVKGE